LTRGQFQTSSEIPRRRGKSQHSLDLIAAAKSILEEIHPASVRAVCYRLFVAGLIPSMSVNHTANVSRLLVDAREQDIIPWSHIVDDSRQIRGSVGWDDPEELMRVMLAAYRKDYWQMQLFHVEVWTEKATVTSTIDPVLEQYGVQARIMKGFGSASAIKKAADFAADTEKPCMALYVGDWDPSGLYMSEVDLSRRLLAYGDPYRQWQILRVALGVVDIMEGGLPFFALSDKQNDPRFEWYRQSMRPFPRPLRGRCWELDALSPVVLRARVENAIQMYLDDAAWERCTRTEALEKESMGLVFNTWKDVKSIDGLLLDTVRRLNDEAISDEIENTPKRTPVPA
jgi:hypothetical protein